jgi:hypothetical protein
MMSAVISPTGVRLDVGDFIASRCVVATGFTDSFEIPSLEAESRHLRPFGSRKVSPMQVPGGRFCDESYGQDLGIWVLRFCVVESEC